MKRQLLFLALALCAFLPLAAQNNPYEIDDECFAYYERCEILTGKEGFKEAADSLLLTAIAKNDTKAQTIYYVEVLRNATHTVPSHQPTTREQDQEVLRLQENLKQVADKLGYPQYFYYSYELVQTYFYNHGKPLKTMELIQEMQQIANQRNDEYGKWMSYRYLVSLYISESDYISAKEYIKKALKIYDGTDDPLVRKQSVCRLYCDLADCYMFGEDSVRINIKKAAESAKVHLDTLRSEYYLAKLTAYERNFPEYQKHRNYCLGDPYLSTVSKSAEKMFETVDSIISGDCDFSEINDRTFSRVREFKFIANFAEVYGYKDEAFNMEKKLVRRYEKLFSSNNRSKITELDARLGNDILKGDLDEKSQQLARAGKVGIIFLITVLLAVLAILLKHQRALRRHNRELSEANERVLMANAAKTRFVQNMSHEVRTPLNAIVGFSQLLGLPDGTFSEQEKDEFASHIVNNSKMLTMLLDDILNASAMDSGKYSIVLEQGEVHTMCHAAITSTEHRLQPGVTMSYEPESAEPFYFVTDPRRVQQILINLLTNSCKHTVSGSIVLASSLTAEPGYVTFAVTGVPADQAEKIFERFAKLNEFVQGTGLGLSICREIAGLMGAKVYLDTSWQGPGARFIFAVPVTPPEELTNQNQ